MNAYDKSYLEKAQTTLGRMFDFAVYDLKVDLKEFFDRFKKDIDSIYKTVIDKNIENGLLVREAGRVYLTSKGIELSNYVMSDMIL